MFRELARQNGWSVYETENGAVHSPELLSRFKAVVWSNASGDNLSVPQRTALQAYIENGGGFIGIHAAGDSSHEDWDWYVKDIIGTRFVGHSLWPHLAQATIHVQGKDHPAMAGLPPKWIRTDEWYSFNSSVRGKGYTVLATLDEATYERGGPGSDKLAMGKDHPIIWSHCQGKGRVFYSALGHTGESFAEPEMRKLITNAVGWVKTETPCDAATQK
jgi:type 1 glutamine amidotransferase